MARPNTAVLVGIVLGCVAVAVATTAILLAYFWPRAALPEQWPSEGGRQARAIEPPPGELVAALPKATAGDVLCTALTRAQWAEVLGDESLREVRPSGGCHVVTAELDVNLAAEPGGETPLGDREVSVAGRTGTIGAGGEDSVSLTVPLVEGLDTESFPAELGHLRPHLVVELRTRRGASGDHRLDAVATTVATRVIDAAVRPGPRLPDADGRGRIAAEPAEPPSGHPVADSALPVMSRQMCTVLAGHLGIPVDETEPAFGGACNVSYRGTRVMLSYSDAHPSTRPDSATETVAGRPALVTDVPESDARTVTLWVRDDNSGQLTLIVRDPDKAGLEATELAEKVIPRLLG